MFFNSYSFQLLYITQAFLHFQVFSLLFLPHFFGSGGSKVSGAFSVRRSAGCRMFRIRQKHARTWRISTACFYTPPYCSSISATPFSTRLISFRSSDRCLILLSFFTSLGTDFLFSFLCVLIIRYYTFCGFFGVCCFSDFRIF